MVEGAPVRMWAPSVSLRLPPPRGGEELPPQNMIDEVAELAEPRRRNPIRRVDPRHPPALKPKLGRFLQPERAMRHRPHFARQPM